MALSNEIASQFAKTVANKDKSRSENAVYGTVVVRNGEKYVRMDGSDLLTPCGATVNAINDERVLILVKNHSVIINGNLSSPAARLGDLDDVMNDTNTTEGGYVGSKMYKEGLEQAKTTIKAAFGDMLLTHRDYLTNAVTDGKPSAGGWFDSQVELMNEIMVYGCHVHAPGGDGATVPYNYTTGRQQFAAAMLNPSIVNLRYWYWLRDVVSSAAFADVGGGGRADSVNASYSSGVRPYFLIG